MPLGNSQFEIRLSALMTRLIGESTLEARTELGAAGNFIFNEGSGALQASAVVDAAVACNNVAAPFSGFSRIDGNAFGSLAKLKGLVLYNPPSNAAVTVTSSIGIACPIPPGGVMTWAARDAAGINISGASTLTAAGGGGSQFLRAILLLA